MIHENTGMWQCKFDPNCSTYIYTYIDVLYIYIYIYIYFTQGGVETICEYLETHFDKSISSNSLCDLASFILKNNYFENEELKDHQKRGFAIGTKFTPPYSNLFMEGLENTIFQNNGFKCGYDTLMRFFVYGPKFPKT